MIPAIGRDAFDTPGAAIARPHANCYWVIPGRLLAGEHPGAIVAAQGMARIDALLDTRVRHFVDLTAEHEGPAPYVPILRERAATRDVRVAHRRFTIPDFGVQQADQFLFLRIVVLNATPLPRPNGARSRNE